MKYNCTEKNYTLNIYFNSEYRHIPFKEITKRYFKQKKTLLVAILLFQN